MMMTQYLNLAVRLWRTQEEKANNYTIHTVFDKNFIVEKKEAEGMAFFEANEPAGVRGSIHHFANPVEAQRFVYLSSLEEALAEIFGRTVDSLNEITELSVAQRQGGPDPMDLEGLDEALTTAINNAQFVLGEIQKEE